MGPRRWRERHLRLSRQYPVGLRTRRQEASRCNYQGLGRGYALSLLLPAASGDVFPAIQNGFLSEHDGELPVRSCIHEFSEYPCASRGLGSDPVLDHELSRIRSELPAKKQRYAQGVELPALARLVFARPVQGNSSPDEPQFRARTLLPFF